MKTYKQWMQIHEEMRLKTKDKDVLFAFTDKKAADSNKFQTDGKRLDGLWMGGNDIAHWKGNKLVFNDLGSKAAQTVQKFIRKTVPKNWIQEAFVDFDDKSNKEVEFPKNVIRVVAKMTDENDHNEARIVVADMLKSVGNRAGAGYIKTYSTFQKMQQKSGDMGSSTVKSRNNADKGLKQELQRTFSNWKDVWKAL